MHWGLIYPITFRLLYLHAPRLGKDNNLTQTSEEGLSMMVAFHGALANHSKIEVNYQVEKLVGM